MSKRIGSSSSPPAKKSRNESNMVILELNESDLDAKKDQYSPIHRINGFPWRLRLQLSRGDRGVLSLICEKSTEAALWECKATVTYIGFRVELEHLFPKVQHTFASWDKPSHTRWIAFLAMNSFMNGGKIAVELTTNEDGESWRRIPTLRTIDPRDGILVVGDEKKKVYVNKQSLSSQSPYFDRLFFGNFKEKNMKEITIEDVESEEFSNLITMIYDFDPLALTNENVHRVLELADRFELKIVEDRVVNDLLTLTPNPNSRLSLSIHQKLVISEEFNLHFLKKKILSKYKMNQPLLKSLRNSSELKKLNTDTVVSLFEMICDTTD